MALIWTAAQLALLARVSLAAFFGYRILLGASEGPALPTALHAAYKWFPDRDRPLVTAILEAAIPIGSALAALTVTRMIVTAGWHVAFGVLASLVCCGAAFGFLWTALRRNPRLRATNDTQAGAARSSEL
jgi:ACS family D-galactonate transporter-like MFS transporter